MDVVFPPDFITMQSVNTCTSVLRPAPTLAALAVLGVLVVDLGAAESVPDASFLKRNCYECHQGKDAEAGLELESLSRDLTDGKTQARWVRIFDRVQNREMPPPDSTKVPAAELDSFLRGMNDWLRAYQNAQDEKLGRVRGRRLTRRELERSLHDLLGIDIPLADQLPEETRSAGFTTVATGQSMSHFQLQRQLEVVDLALDEAFRRATGPEDHYQRD